LVKRRVNPDLLATLPWVFATQPQGLPGSRAVLEVLRQWWGRGRGRSLPCPGMSGRGGPCCWRIRRIRWPVRPRCGGLAGPYGRHSRPISPRRPH